MTKTNKKRKLEKTGKVKLLVDLISFKIGMPGGG